MRLLAFDMKDNGNWRKQWDSLATGFTVFTCNVSDERESGMNAIRTTINGGQKILVLIHQEPCGSRVDITGWKNEKPPGLYVMYVHGSGCSLMGTEPNWVYAAKRPVPSDADLTYLHKEFASLCENLEKAISVEDVTGAWRAFEPQAILEDAVAWYLVLLAETQLGKHVGTDPWRREAWNAALAEFNKVGGQLSDVSDDPAKWNQADKDRLVEQFRALLAGSLGHGAGTRA